MSILSQGLRRAALLSHGDGLTDDELLEDYVMRRDEAAFEVLVRRHGPMVWGVCRRLLGSSHDADDAFQAVFLVLVRRAASIRPRDAVGPWLHGVAYRTACKARSLAARRRMRERQLQPPQPTPALAFDDVRGVLDRAIQHLPENSRRALVLCDLEGVSRKDAARLLGWREGTLSGRLARARALLAKRVARYRLALAAGALLSATKAEAGLSSLLVKTTVKAAAVIVTGRATAGAIATAPATLMEGVLRAMWWIKVRMCVIAFVSILLAGGALWYTWPAAAADAPKADQQLPTLQVVRAESEQKDQGKISIAALPPVVVDTIPKSGFNRVDAAKTTAIYVRFSKEMEDGSWSWSQLSDDTFPKLTGKPHYEKDLRQCVLPVKLEPGKTYAIWINSEKFHNFKDKSGKAAVPYLLVFETKTGHALPGR